MIKIINCKFLYIFLLSIVFVWVLTGCSRQKPVEHINLAIPYSDNVQDYDSNYYIKWLEEKTGVDIDVTVIRNTRSDEYLNTFFSSDTDIDAVLFGGDFTVDEETIASYINKPVVDSASLYYSNSGLSKSSGCGQVLWINSSWLSNLNLSVPSNTEELYNVLLNFKTKDPNGNGINDELPLVGNVDEYEFNPMIYILNSYIYTDPYHSYHYMDNDVELFAPTDKAYREGVSFCSRLYKDELLDKITFECSREELSELVNSPVNIVGAFTTDSIADVIYQDNPEIMAKYIHVPPLSGPAGTCNALYREYKPSVGALINYRSKHYDSVKKVLDTMMTTEASLIARYGQEGVDWEFAKEWDVGIYGAAATIVTKNYIWNTRQNKHLSGIGPMNVPDEYLSGVTWNGVNSDTEYIDARAKTRYEDYFPKKISGHKEDSELNSYIDNMLESFVKGDMDVNDEKNWNDYCNYIDRNFADKLRQ